MPPTQVPKYALTLLACLAPRTFAQSPISIEQLLAKAATWQVSSSVDYRASMPTPLQLERQTSVSTGLRYGLNSRFEINARLESLQFSQSIAGQRLRERQQSLSLGSNWLIKRESFLPAVLLETRAVLASNGSFGPRDLPSAQIAVTSYKSIDPVVLSLTVAMNIQRSYRDESAVVKPGVSWRIEPNVNFAVNPSVTLFGGAAMERRNASRIGESTVMPAMERVALRGGMALSLAQRHSIFVSGDLGSDRSGGMSVQWFYEF